MRLSRNCHRFEFVCRCIIVLLPALFVIAFAKHSHAQLKYEPPVGFEGERTVTTKLVESGIFTVRPTIVWGFQHGAIIVEESIPWGKIITEVNLVHGPDGMMHPSAFDRVTTSSKSTTTVHGERTSQGMVLSFKPKKFKDSVRLLASDDLALSRLERTHIEIRYNSDGRPVSVRIGEEGFNDELLIRALANKWDRVFARWLSTSPDKGSKYASVDTMTITIPTDTAIIVYRVTHVVGKTRRKGRACLILRSIFDSNYGTLDSTIGESFWDIYEGDFMPPDRSRELAYSGYEELIIDKEALIIHEEESFQQLQRIESFTVGDETYPNVVIHIFEKTTKVKCKYKFQ